MQTLQWHERGEKRRARLANGLVAPRSVSATDGGFAVSRSVLLLFFSLSLCRSLRERPVSSLLLLLQCAQVISLFVVALPVLAPFGGEFVVCNDYLPGQVAPPLVFRE